jgi:hypothetical protein
MGVADVTVANSPITFAYAATNSAVAAWVFPTNRPQNIFVFPNSNTRQIVILNTGANALLFGLVSVASQALLPSAVVLGIGIPYAFPAVDYPLAAGGAIPVIEGDNCTRIPAGASFSVDLLSFQERGNFFPIRGTDAPLQPTAYPLNLIFFGAATAGQETTADITYVNKLGLF